MAKQKRKNDDRGSLQPGFKTLEQIAEGLNLGKLTRSQTHNVVGDIIGAVLCLSYLITSKDEVLKLLCVLVVGFLIGVCVFGTERRRWF